jgi:hypothetical protein
MSSQHPRIRRERETIARMTEIYCRDRHGARGGQLCPDCQSLQDYALLRLMRCPYQENKPTCAKCPVHCYKADMRAKVRVMMAYSGPRMLFRHPRLAILHLLDGLREPPESSRKTNP